MNYVIGIINGKVFIMKNFGFLPTIFECIKRFCNNNEDKHARLSLGTVIMRCFFSFIGCMIFLFALMKVYEVPVYYTNIDINCFGFSPEEPGLHVTIMRNYDRYGKPSFVKDHLLENNIFRQGKHSGGIFISGRCRSDSAGTHHSYNSDERYDSIMSPICDKMKSIGLEYNFSMLYSSVITTYRQSFDFSTRRPIHCVIEIHTK